MGETLFLFPGAGPKPHSLIGLKKLKKSLETPGFFKPILLFAVRAYKTTISPLIRPACRFTPTCSEYAKEAFERFGAGKGLFLALKRLLRCNPLFRGGYDPVPEAFHVKQK